MPLEVEVDEVVEVAEDVDAVDVVVEVPVLVAVELATWPVVPELLTAVVTCPELLEALEVTAVIIKPLVEPVDPMEVPVTAALPVDVTAPVLPEAASPSVDAWKQQLEKAITARHPLSDLS